MKSVAVEVAVCCNCCILDHSQTETSAHSSFQQYQNARLHTRGAPFNARAQCGVNAVAADRRLQATCASLLATVTPSLSHTTATVADFLFVTGWGRGGSNTRPSAQRSLTPTPAPKSRAPIPLPHKLVKSSSSPHINRDNMAAVAMPRQPMSAIQSSRDMSDDFTTRTPSPVQRTDSNDSQHPDLSNEVAMLSTKLINAINYQTNLDDSLQHTRHELEQSRERIKKLEEENRQWNEQFNSGVLLKRLDVDKQIAQLRAELAQEKAAREEADKGKRKVESELENLTTALFEEANTMVASARRETESVERRSSQLKSQLHDTELLLASQQEQLQDLKSVMEKMSERGDAETPTSVARDSSVPTTPITHATAMFESLQLSPNTPGAIDIPPDHPLRFSHLLTPVMRTDVQAYTDFQDLLTTARKASPHSRSTSQTSNALTSNVHASLGTYNAASSSSPNLPGSFSASNSPSQSNFSSSSNLPPLKESKFYKRALTEDLEPTLRLDLAPGLSFLSRRTVLSSLLAGSLVVEPFLPSHKFYGPVYACALCGESRKNEPYVRKHRFRTSEEDNAQRYPLCDYCLGRIRASGDFVGFLRMVRDGLWRSESGEEQKAAWEESVRLRERMFWARLGGGVIPTLATPRTAIDSPRPGKGRASLDSIAERDSRTAEAPETPEKQIQEDLFNATNKRASAGSMKAILTRPSLDHDGEVEIVPKDVTPMPSEALAPPQQESVPPTSEPTTPFEDAQSEAGQLGEPAASEASADAVDADGASKSEPESAAQAAAATSAVVEPLPAPTAERSRSRSPHKKTGSSSVLDRVRSMNQAVQAGEKKLPGAFD